MSWQKLVLSLLVLAILRSPAMAETAKKLLLLGQGPDGHPPQAHEYVAGLRIIEKCLKAFPGLDVTFLRADDPWKEGPGMIERADGVVLYLAEGAKWISNDRRRREAFSELAARKGGLVALHWAIGTRDAAPIDDYLKLFGGCHGGPDRKFKIVTEGVHIADPQHPITFGIRDFRVQDEFYYQLKLVKPEGSIRPVLQVPIDGKDQTVAWSWERPDGGRSFGFSGLHFHENWRLPEYRRLVVQGILWALKMPIAKDGVNVDVTERDLKLK